MTDLGNPINVSKAAAADEARVQPRVADVEYPNVPATTEPQQAATGPGSGTVADPVVADPGAAGTTSGTPEKLPFKEQVNGYAKKIAGTVFRNKDEKEFGEQKLQGNA